MSFEDLDRPVDGLEGTNLGAAPCIELLPTVFITPAAAGIAILRMGPPASLRGSSVLLLGVLTAPK